jgi:hypothetical protein
MAVEPLKAFPDMVFINRKGGLNTGTTHIVYTRDAIGSLLPILWHRFVGTTWKRIQLSTPFILNSPSGDPQRDGEFPVTMHAGQVYQVLMYHYPQQEFVNPNKVDPTDPTINFEDKPDALLTVVAMLKDPERMDFIVDNRQGFGGTWFSRGADTTVPTSFMLQVSKNPPFKDNAGVERFLAPMITVFNPSSMSHDGVIERFLLPGNNYFFLMRLVDDDGNWQIVSDQFRTKQRTVTIDFEVLHIINDGAQGDTTAEFRIWVMEGNLSVKDYFFGDVDNFPITDRPDPDKRDMEFIPLGDQVSHAASFCAPFILGPKDITENTNEIGILTRGLIFRAFPNTNEHASNFVLGDDFPNPTASVPPEARFRFRTGLGENMQQHVPLVVRARPQTDDVEFEYDVTMFFTVHYT